MELVFVFVRTDSFRYKPHRTVQCRVLHEHGFLPSRMPVFLIRTATLMRPMLVAGTAGTAASWKAGFDQLLYESP